MLYFNYFFNISIKRENIFYVDLRVETQIHPDTLLRWLQKQVALYDKVHIEDMGASFKDGLAICAIIHRYRPDLINFYSLNAEDVVKNNQLAFDILEKELNIPPVSMLHFYLVCCNIINYVDTHCFFLHCLFHCL